MNCQRTVLSNATKTWENIGNLWYVLLPIRKRYVIHVGLGRVSRLSFPHWTLSLSENAAQEPLCTSWNLSYQFLLCRISFSPARVKLSTSGFRRSLPSPPLDVKGLENDLSKMRITHNTDVKPGLTRILPAILALTIGEFLMNHKNDADWHCDKRSKTFSLLLLLLQYGYRLPQEENVFYNVHFYYIQGKTFTYPLSTNKQELRSSHDPQMTQFSISIFPL